MTVRDAIKVLKQCDPNMPILLETPRTTWNVDYVIKVDTGDKTIVVFGNCETGGDL